MQTIPNHFHDALLIQLRDKKIPLTLFLMSGFQIHCTLIDFDRDIVLVNATGKQ